MSDDLIKREDVIAILKDLQKNHLQFCYIPFRQAIEMVEAVPSADRPQGEWERIPYSLAGGYRCSICGQKSLENHWNFCPNCGCWMKGADDENN